MRRVRSHILGVLEAGLADIQPVELLADQLIWIEGRVPCFEVHVPQHDAADVEIGIVFAGRV